MTSESDLRRSTLISILNREIAPALGCTDPIAVAYSVAIARKALGGAVRAITVSVDPGLYKNAMRVGIPGSAVRGLHMAAALGFVAGDPDKAYRVIEGVTAEDLRKAMALVESGVIAVRTDERFDSLYIETVLATDLGVRRVVTLDKYLNASLMEVGQRVDPPRTAGKEAKPEIEPPIRSFELEELIAFAESVPLGEVGIIEQGIEMNSRIASRGMESENGIGRKLSLLVEQGKLGASMATRAQVLCSAAAEARMSGCVMPVMSSAGSGNHGITVFLTCSAAAETLGCSRERLVRSLVLANLVTVAIKSYTGTLSAMCGCGVAAGVGASAGVAYLLGGDRDAMMGAMMNMIASISGVVCDGAKEGCALKLAMASGWAVQAAMLAVAGAVVPQYDGIVSPDMKRLFANLGDLCTVGMSPANKSIIGIMQASERGKPSPACD